MGISSKMATLKSRILLLRKIQNNSLSSIAQRSMGGSPPPWTYLWKPGPYPETDAERIAAAKKYGLIPEDYEPYPNDGRFNDSIGHQNFGEPLHYNFYKQQETRYDDTTKHRYSEWQSFGMFLLAIAVFGGPYLILKDYPLHKPCTIDQLPYRGKTYYTFEPAEE